MSNSTEVRLSPQGIPVAEAIPLKGALKMLADHMAKSHSEYAAYTVMGEIDVTKFEAFRKELVPKLEKESGVHVSFTHLMVKVIAQSIRAHPIINTTLVDGEILVLEDINIGVAVATPSGFLVVPVIKQADRKSLLEVAQDGAAKAERAREGKLVLDDVTQGTFTLTNAGMFGARTEGGHSTPIITVPQSAILGVSGIHQKPVVREGEIVIRTIMPYSFTIDHRVINGVPANLFMGTIAELMGEPESIKLGL